MDINGEIVVALFRVFAPLVVQIYDDHKAETGAAPTNEEMVARLQLNAATYLAEGAAWRATHPAV